MLCVVVPQISRSLANLTADSKETEREKLAKEIGRIRTMAEDIAANAAQLQTEGTPVIGESLLHAVDSLEDQLSGNKAQGIISPELPLTDAPQHTPSSPGKPSLPKRRDSKRRYMKYSASAKRSSPTPQDGGKLWVHAVCVGWGTGWPILCLQGVKLQ